MLPEVSNYIEQFEPQQAAMLHLVREIILQSHPAIQEKFTYKTPFYLLKGYLCYFTYHKTRKRFILGFVKGHLMEDPYGLLKADDKQKFIRHFVLDDRQFIDPDKIATYLQIAIEINENSASNTLFF